MKVPTASSRVALALALAATGSSVFGPGAVLSAQEVEGFTLRNVAPPEGLTWVSCPGGQDQAEVAVIGTQGGAIALREGHSLVISQNAIPLPWPFVFAELPGNEVAVVATAPRVSRLAGAGAILTLSWANRPGCEVSDSAVIVQLPQRGPAIRHRSHVDQRTRTIVTTDTITGFSLFAIAR